MRQNVPARILCGLALFAAGCQTASRSREAHPVEAIATAERQTESIACPSQATMCPMIFEPARCELQTKDGQSLQTEGSNACVARSALQAQFCSGKNSAPGPFQVQIACKKKQEAHPAQSSRSPSKTQ